MKRIVLICCVLGFLNSCMAKKEKTQTLFDSIEKLSNSYGICSHITRDGVLFDFDTRNNEKKLMVDLGIDYVRTDFDWYVCQPKENDALNYTQHKEALDVIGDDLKILGILTPFTPRRTLNQWEIYVKATTHKFKDRVNCWEIVNEADLVKYRIKDFTPEEYVKMLKSAYSIVKNNYPQKDVVYSGLCDVNCGFFERTIELGASRYFDIMNIHNYANKDREPERLIPYFKKLNDYFIRYKINKKVWLTETGCTTMKGWASEMTQSIRLPRIFIISFACGIEKVFWYKTRSNEINKNDKECFLGLVHKDYTPKPAYYSYKTLIKMCPNRSTRPKLEKNGNVYSATWKRPDGKNVWALWTSKSEEVVKLNIKGKYKIYNLNGDEQSYNSCDYTITPSIIYIVGAKNVDIVN